MKLIAFINTIANHAIRNDNAFMTAGYANGYVAIPPSHPYFAVDCCEIPVDVHGGLSFGEIYLEDGLHDNWFNTVEWLGEDSFVPYGWRILGFDTLHYGDNLDTWPKERCIKETLMLKYQLDAMSNNVIFK